MSDLIKKSEDADLEVMPSFNFVLEKEAEQQTPVFPRLEWQSHCQSGRIANGEAHLLHVPLRLFDR